jgi:gamma-glutamyl-gamma-aminobutyrate hydrolase PuuD
VAVAHEVVLADGTTATVNSFHRAGVLAAQLAPSLRIVAATRSGVVEAFDDPDRSISAVQWHPERPGSPAALDRSILRGWLGRCA